MNLTRATALGSLLLLALGGSVLADDPSPSPVPGSPAPEQPSIEATPWRLVELVTDGTPMRIPLEASVTLTLADDAFGDAGCNRFSGPYTLRDSAIQIGPLGSTKMACAKPLMKLEGRYLQALEAVRTARLVPGLGEGSWDLELRSPTSSEILHYVQDVPVPLVGTGWTLVAYTDADGRVVAADPATPAPIEFREDGTVAGSTGCNAFSGPFTSQGRALRIGPLATTLVLCMEALGDQDVAVTANLPRVAMTITSYDPFGGVSPDSVEAGLREQLAAAPRRVRLFLNDASGENLLIYEESRCADCDA